ncbi:hypothetical protein IMZ48_30590, partial [Candidatus Bathyarchaeota archaeon]|nr:hypothetical protein [Candidatus Bathyarchaeota archaeon]
NMVCHPTNIFAIIPIACIVGTGFFFTAIFLWFRVRAHRKQLRLEADASRRYSDDSNTLLAPALPTPMPGDGASRVPQQRIREALNGTRAPPSSLASEAGGPWAGGPEPQPRYSDVVKLVARRLERKREFDKHGNRIKGSDKDRLEVRTRGANYVGNYSTIVPARGSATSAGKSGIATLVAEARANGTMNDNEAAPSNYEAAGPSDYEASSPTHTSLFGTTYDSAGRVVIRPPQAPPRRTIEIPGRAYPISQRGSIIGVVDEGHESDVSYASAVAGTSERASIYEVETSDIMGPFSGQLSPASKGKDVERASQSGDSDSMTLGKDAPFELGGNPIHELGIDGAINPPAETEQKDDGKKDGSESSVKQ